MAGTRSDGIINESTLLSVQGLKNGSNYEFHSFLTVHIHDNYTEAQNDQDVKQIIPANKISHVGNGLYNYTVSEISGAGTYFDKIFVIPDPGQPEWTNIHTFYIRKESYGSSAPGEIETAVITFSIFDCVANAQVGDKVFVEMNLDIAWYGKSLIEKEREMFSVGTDGMIVMNLIETDTLSVDSGQDVYYTIHVSRRGQGTQGDYVKKFTVPKGTINSDLVDLPTYTP